MKKLAPLTPFVIALHGCVITVPDGSLLDVPQSTTGSSEQGGALVSFQLPLALGVEKMCTQGAGGSRSHTSSSTRHDIDLDTDNNAQEEVYASVSGIARVHMESATSGFGYHVSIDLGDGTYFVIAHLSEIFISDGEEVTAGQLIGYEGNTGDSTGDHVHVGLHRGDAGQTADHGVSLPTSYWVRDMSQGGVSRAVASQDFICGLASQGDARDGNFYESQLSVPLWHPDGSLVKTPDNARVYLIDNGRARWIQNESVFWGMDLSFSEVVLVSDEELSCLGEGGDILSAISIPQWDGLRQGDLVKETDASDVYFVADGRALPILNWQTFLLAGLGNRSITVVPAGTVEAALQMGNCAADVWCLDAPAFTTCGGGIELDGTGQGGESGDDDDDDASPPADDDDSTPESDDDDTPPPADDDDDATAPPPADGDDDDDASGLHDITITVSYPLTSPAVDFSFGYCSNQSDPANCLAWNQSVITATSASSVSFVVQNVSGGSIRANSSRFFQASDWNGNSWQYADAWLCEWGPVMTGTVSVEVDGVPSGNGGAYCFNFQSGASLGIALDPLLN